MKKFLAGLVMLFVVMVSFPLSTDAQCRVRRSHYRRSYSRNYNRYANRSYGTQSYVYQQPSFYRRHRNLVNLGAATGGGALIGALLGGKHGALLGTGIGAGSGALYTYVLNKKKRRYNAVYYPRYRNR